MSETSRALRQLSRRIALLALFCSAATLALPAVSRAATTLFVATSGSDANSCTQVAPCATISHALAAAASGDTIDVGPGTFDENLKITTTNVTITGAGAPATTVYGGLVGPVFTFASGGSGTISSLAISGGATTGGSGVGVNSGSSATLLNDIVAFNSSTGEMVETALSSAAVSVDVGAQLTVSNTAIFGNQTGGTSLGLTAGGIAVNGAARIVNSAIYQNSDTATGEFGYGGPAGGIAVAGGTLVLANSTVSGNRAAGNGGGLALLDNGSASLSGDTIFGNTAAAGGGVAFVSPGFAPLGTGTAVISDTIIAANSGGNCDQHGFSSTGYDLEDDSGASCGFSAARHDLVGVNPDLGALASNGGPTETAALLAGSPAIGAGNCTAVDTAVGADVDQRGSPRRFAKRGVCDIGAWDSGGSLSGVVVQTAGPLQATKGLPARLTLKASGGTGSYTWSLVSGALPTGLALGAGGTISGTPTTAGVSNFAVAVSDNATPTPHLARQSLSITVYAPPVPGVWVANGANSVLNSFALGSNGDVPPASTLAGAQTQLDAPDGLAFDSVGDLYVVNAQSPSVTVYQAGSGAAAPPIRTIMGPATGLFSPAGVALDAAGRVYVSDEAANSVTVYASTASGNAKPLRTISGSSTGLGQPWGLAIDSAGHLWVANYALSTLTEYASGAHGNVAPIATIAGAGTGLANPLGLGQDAAGHLIAVNNPANTVLEYANAAPFGNASPVFGLGGSMAALSGPKSVDVDAADRLYVADSGGVKVFAPGAFSPEATIAAGSISGINGPDAVAVEPPLTITTPRLPDAAFGRRYSVPIGVVLGRKPLHWRLRRGRLPAGLRLGRNGVLRGTPLQLGAFHFTLSVRDSTKPAMSSTQRITLIVRDAPRITGIRKASGPAQGGRRVTILGTGFAPGRGHTIISFGRMNALDVVCRTQTICTARTPPHAAGTVSVTAAVFDLRSAPDDRSRYRYRR